MSEPTTSGAATGSRRFGGPVVAVAAAIAVISAIAGSAFVAVNFRPAGTTSPASDSTPSVTAAVSAGATATPHQGPVIIHWQVGLGAGTQPNQVEAQRDFAARFNESQERIILQIDPLPMMALDDIIRALGTRGDPPDIVGPVGAWSRHGLDQLLMDLAPLVQSHHVDTGIWEPVLLDLLKVDTGSQIGLPYTTHPAFMFYNKDIFKKAGLPDLPRKVGEPYMGSTWDWDAVAEIGERLTLDASGRNPSQAGFDPNSIVQWGFDAQWWDGRRLASAFGGGSFVASDGRTAQIPPQWADAWNWYYDAMWKRHFAPTAKYRSSVLLNEGTTISSGRIAMAATNPWTIFSYGTKRDSKITSWDMAVVPSWKGRTVGPLDADTFAILRSSPHPDEAFEVILALMSDQELMEVYSGMPADKRLRPGWFADFDKSLNGIFPGNRVSWSVLEEMARYPAIPSHESDMPGYWQATDYYNAFYTKLQSEPGLDVDAELARLRADLQAVFDDALAKPSPSPAP